MCYAVSAYSPCAMLCRLGPHVLCRVGLFPMCYAVSAYSPCAMLCRLIPHVLCCVGLVPTCYVGGLAGTLEGPLPGSNYLAQTLEGPLPGSNFSRISA